MKRTLHTGLAFLLLAGAVTAQADDFRRERGRDTDASKNALETKAPPALVANSWMNTPDGQPLKLSDLRGKVVLIDFWGTW